MTYKYKQTELILVDLHSFNRETNLSPDIFF